MGFGTLINDKLFGEEKKRRISEWNALYEKGALTPEDYRTGMEEYIQTGRVPQKATGLETRRDVTPKMVSSAPNGAPMVTFPTTVVKPQMEQIPLGKPMFAINKETGESKPLSNIPRNAEVLAFDPTIRQPRNATAYLMDDKGNIVKSMPITGVTDQFIPLSKLAPGGGRAPAETPQEKVYRQVLAEYLRALKSGKGVSQDLGDAAAQAARALGLPVETIQGDPATIIERLGKILSLGMAGQWSDIPSYERPAFVQGSAPKEFTSPQDVEAAARAGLVKPGDIVLVNGRRAVWEQ